MSFERIFPRKPCQTSTTLMLFHITMHTRPNMSIHFLQRSKHLRTEWTREGSICVCAHVGDEFVGGGKGFGTVDADVGVGKWVTFGRVDGFRAWVEIVNQCVEGQGWWDTVREQEYSFGERSVDVSKLECEIKGAVIRRMTRMMAFGCSEMKPDVEISMTDVKEERRLT
ncbi:hypothetical protein BC829DRAFT_433731 [Chytridium lagenaria]|nr:hypothetical protein BC829DRAFT_433731 [Chytridium lagenaria]